MERLIDMIETMNSHYAEGKGVMSLSSFVTCYRSGYKILAEGIYEESKAIWEKECPEVISIVDEIFLK